MQTYNNFLDEDFADYLYNYANDVMINKNEDCPRVSSNYEWHYDVRHDSAPVFTIKLKEEFIEKFKKSLVKFGFFDESLHEPLQHVTLYVWTRESYIPLHSDQKYGKALTVYLNREWEYKDGGMLHWLDRDINEWKAILPSFNLCVLNNQGVEHATTPVKATDKFRITIQCFIYNKKNGTI